MRGLDGHKLKTNVSSADISEKGTNLFEINVDGLGGKRMLKFFREEE